MLGLDAEMVLIYAFRQSFISLALDFTVQEDFQGLTVLEAHFGQFIDLLFAQGGIADQINKFLVEEFDRFSPIDLGVDRGKAQVQEGFKAGFDQFLPGAIKIRSWIKLKGHLRVDRMDNSSGLVNAK